MYVYAVVFLVSCQCLLLIKIFWIKLTHVLHIRPTTSHLWNDRQLRTLILRSYLQHHMVSRLGQLPLVCPSQRILFGIEPGHGLIECTKPRLLQFGVTKPPVAPFIRTSSPPPLVCCFSGAQFCTVVAKMRHVLCYPEYCESAGALQTSCSDPRRWKYFRAVHPSVRGLLLVMCLVEVPCPFIGLRIAFPTEQVTLLCALLQSSETVQDWPPSP